MISGCISPETKTNSKNVKDTSVKSATNTDVKSNVKDQTVEKPKSEGSNLDPTKECGPGEAIQKFDLGSEDGTSCVSVASGEARSAEPNNGGNIATSFAAAVNWILRIDGDSNTDSRIGEGSIIDLHEGEGISLTKEGNAVTISSTVAPSAGSAGATITSSSNGSGSSTWTLTVPTSKGSSTSMSVGDGSSLKIKGNGATSVSLDNKLRELTVSSAEYVWNLAADFFGTGFQIKSGDTIRILGGGATTVTSDNTNKRITISTPAVKQYQYRTLWGSCEAQYSNTGFGSIPTGWTKNGDTGMEVECKSGAQMTARCTEGKIINYGGRCQRTGENDNSIQYLSPEHLAVDSTAYTKTWSDSATINKVLLKCESGFTSYMHLFVTCMREKP